MASQRIVCARCGGVIGPGTGYVRGPGGKPEHLKCPPKEKSRPSP
jgi:hypothetical protein